MKRAVTYGVASIAVFTVFLCYLASQDVARNLSPQGCRMSRMSPSYIPQPNFNKSWTRLADRYSLWLYREVGWESNTIDAASSPVLFIPGNAGSSHQVRSIASSAARQYYTHPRNANRNYVDRGVKRLDVYAVEFNEDLTAFHGPTMEAQIEYTSSAIRYILAQYPHNTTITVMGHSMGGIVATSLLQDSEHISAIITMSTPHTLPPARFDHRIEQIYDRTKDLLLEADTPILSLCGGATDMMIPSESCILPQFPNEETFRRTVFTSALEGAWTGVGHREMVWCHQVRWRVARAMLEMTTVITAVERGRVLDAWLRDGHTLPPPQDVLSIGEQELIYTYERVEEGKSLFVPTPNSKRTYLMKVPEGTTFTLLVSKGAIPPVSPQKPNGLEISVLSCDVDEASEAITCDKTIRPDAHKLMPNPAYGKTFPVPQEGSDESEGVVLFQMTVSSGSGQKWIGVRVDKANRSGWILGGVDNADPIANNVSLLGLALKSVRLVKEDTSLQTTFWFPRLLSHTLVVYRVTPHVLSDASKCQEPILPPLLVHTSHKSETHYFALTKEPHMRRILLHTHSPAPYIVPMEPISKGVEFTVYSSGILGCGADVTEFTIAVDWTSTVGRWATRYFTTVVSWAIAVVSLLFFGSWGALDNNRELPSVLQELSTFCGSTLPRLLVPIFLTALLPLPETMYTGNGGEPMLAILAPLLLVVSSGLVFVSYWVLLLLIWPLKRVSMIISRRKREEDGGAGRGTVASMLLILALVFLVIPWQVAFLGCWFIQLFTVASSGTKTLEEGQSSSPRRDASIENRKHNMYVLLLMTWLLPLAAPVLVVWVRTLAQVGLTTPFDGDHFVLSVAPFLACVDFASWTSLPIFEKNEALERKVSVRWVFAVVAAVALLLGPRKAFLVFDASKIAVGVVVIVRIGPRYWGRGSWTWSNKRS